MPPVGFETTISAGEWPKTYGLDRASTGTGIERRMQSAKNVLLEVKRFPELKTVLIHKPDNYT
jgi:hypothetical protein